MRKIIAHFHDSSLFIQLVSSIHSSNSLLLRTNQMSDLELDTDEHIQAQREDEQLGWQWY